MSKQQNINQNHATNTKQNGFVLGLLFLLVLIAAMVMVTLYIIQLDRTVVNKFEGKRWNIPAKVYSKPLELYQGASVDTATVDKWLRLLNYRSNSKYNTSGSFHKANSTYYIHTRGFSYGNDDIENEQIIKININNGRVTSVQSTQQNKTGIIRLEPVNIGGIYPDNNEDRTVVSLKDTPQPLIDALIATEDRNFYNHKGISFRGIARAVINNFSGKSMQGGSTLTQQLIKNFYLNSERSFKRKANEAVMAVLLEIHYDKNQILQAYMNEINLGQNGNRSINGFGLAAQFYFNRPLKELKIDQQAMLVGLAKGPSYYNPRKHPERAKERRNVVLNNMLVTGKLSQTEYEKAIKQPLGVVKKASVGKSRFPDFLDIVKRELNEFYDEEDLKNEGLRIISTIDPIAQMAADKAIANKLTGLRKASSKHLESALVSANPETGELAAVVGSGNDFTGFNRAIDAKRQVGSLLKPVIYLTALQSKRYTLASPVEDSPITLNINGNQWTPQNYDGRDHGYVSLTTALAKSYNQAAVRLGMEFGVDTFVKQLKNMGIRQNIEPYPSVLLGSVALTPMDILGVYQVFATGGFRTPIHSIRSVIDDKGNVLQRVAFQTQQSVPTDANYLTNYAMQQVVKQGTAKKALSLGKHLNLAGKTGTTNDYKDAWFAGYSGNYVSVVWVGRDDNKSIGLSGSSGALPIWIDYMRRLNLTPVSLPQPDNIEWMWLENGEGTLSNELCPNARYMPIIVKTIPKGASNCALGIYEQEILQEQQYEDIETQQNEAIQRQREYEGLTQFEPNNGTHRKQLDPNNSNRPEGKKSPQNSEQPTWYDKALEWF